MPLSCPPRAGTRVSPDYSTNSKLYNEANGDDVLSGLVTRRFPEVGLWHGGVWMSLGPGDLLGEEHACCWRLRGVEDAGTVDGV